MPVITAGNATVSLTPDGGSAVVADFARAKVTLNTTLIDTTDVGATYLKLTPTFAQASATIEAFYKQSTHGALRTVLTGGTFLSAASVSCDGTLVSGKAQIESIEWDVAPNGVLMATLTLKWANGAIS